MSPAPFLTQSPKTPPNKAQKQTCKALRDKIVFIPRVYTGIRIGKNKKIITPKAASVLIINYYTTN